MVEVERAIRADPRSAPTQISFLDAVDERRRLFAHMRDRHNRVFRAQAISLDELRALDRVLHEDDE